MGGVRSAALWTTGIVLAVALAWGPATPAGFIGSPAGTCITAGFLPFPVGLFPGAGGDRGPDNLPPGANVAHMTEQGQRGERRLFAPRPRCGGTPAMVGGVICGAIGALL